MNREMRRQLERAAKKGTRPKRKPKGVILDTVGYATESVTLLKDHDGYSLRWSVEARTAWARITHGAGNLDDSNKVMAAYNIVSALAIITGYEDGAGALQKAEDAIFNLCARAKEKGKLIATGPEIVAINELMQIHDEFLDCITVKQIEQAYALAKQRINSGQARRVPKQ